MEYLRGVTVSLMVPVDGEEGLPNLKDFIHALEENLKWWKSSAKTDDLTGFNARVEYGIVMNRNGPDDVWVH